MKKIYKNIFRMFDKQVKNSFIFLPEYKCFIFKEVNNITDNVNLFYIFCDSKIKNFNLLMERYLGTVEYDRIFVNRESFFGFT